MNLSSKTLEEKVRQLLKSIIDPEYNQPITKFVDKIIINNNKLLFNLNYPALNQKDLAQKNALAQQCKDIINNNFSLSAVAVNVVSLKDEKKNKVKILPPGVKKIIAIASGKGGVGKSTVASFIAKTLAEQGKKVGMLDADIYGPSLPHIFPRTKPLEIIDDNFIPHNADGINIMSLGYLISENSAAAWRGLMATKTLHQFMRQTNWATNGELDYLIIDMPPGTGDIHLTICENYDISSIILITTPHQLSVIDVRRAIDFYQKVGVKILGVIENMSYLEINGEAKNIFGTDGAKNIANANNLPLLCSVPILAAAADIDFDNIIYKKKLFNNLPI